MTKQASSFSHKQRKIEGKIEKIVKENRDKMSSYKEMSNFESVGIVSNHSIKKMSVMNKQDPLIKLHSHARDYL